MAERRSAEDVLEEIERERDAPRGAGSKMGRPPRLSRRDEFELYRYRKSGVPLRTCASFFRVSTATAKRAIAKFRDYDARIEPIAREFRATIDSLRDS